MAIFKALTFDGVNSLDYGIYITGEAVYNAPERAVEMVNIPGKNGALALDQRRFENIEVTYHAGCFADSQADFADKVMRFRNALASRYTYKRLTDEYHPDEYRLGLYKSGLDVDAVRYGTAGEFNIVFDCKPQRFLIDGDRAISPTEWSDLQTESGELVTIESDGSLAVKSLEVSLEPIQAGSGEPSPSNVRAISGRTEVVTRVAGKNLLPSHAVGTATANGLTTTYYADGSLKINGTATASTDVGVWYSGNVAKGIQGSYKLNGCTNGAASRYQLIARVRNTSASTNRDVRASNGDVAISTNATEVINNVYINVKSGIVMNNVMFYPMLRLASDTDATYEPYNGQTYTTALGRTVYGGTLDVVSGVLTVDTMYSSTTWSAMDYPEVIGTMERRRWRIGTNMLASQVEGVSNIVPWNAGGYAQDRGARWYNDATSGFFYLPPNTAGNTAIEAVFKLATPQTYQLTPQQIELLVGENHLRSDGEITVEYGVHPYYNPTPFESKPLIKVTDTGTLGIGEYILTITGTASQTLYIDCETMEIYALEGTVPTGASSLVSINKNDFPVLEPGTNYISVGSGITAVTITPRWWRI